jgi:type II secretory pathway pseudopilin PulG
MSRTAFTLLEVLLSASLLAAITAAAFSWVITMERTNRSAIHRLQALGALQAVGDAVRDDLLYALADDQGRRYEMAKDRLQLRTLNRLPGDPLGAQHVRWRFEPRQRLLVREIIPASGEEAEVVRRVISRQLDEARFIQVSGIPTLVCRGKNQEQELSLPLGTRDLP